MDRDHLVEKNCRDGEMREGQEVTSLPMPVLQEISKAQPNGMEVSPAKPASRVPSWNPVDGDYK